MQQVSSNFLPHLRRHVDGSAHCGGSVVPALAISGEQLGQAEVCQFPPHGNLSSLRVHYTHPQHIVRLEVPVEDVLGPVGVQVVDGLKEMVLESPDVALFEDL